MLDRAKYLARQQRYNASEKGRARHDRYEVSEKGREVRARYEASYAGWWRNRKHRLNAARIDIQNRLDQLQYEERECLKLLEQAAQAR